MKQFFADNQVDYLLKDIRKDSEARKELVQVYKKRSVPVTVIGDEVIHGFIEPVLRKALGL
ncbi:glutaredoxin family protein [Clostridium sp. 'deep sea']|nr:glutaredoxin family protein [Clostridium sp. 'deep sea']